jgi:DNA-binding LytR/AlgR family response regulator
MNCVIVDDEKLARDVLEHYVLKTPQLQLTGQMSNALDLFRHLHSDAQTDLVFLDIKMPEMTGLELVAALKQVPHIIFTTAYHEYALDAFNLNAIDYLLKPFSYERSRGSVIYRRIKKLFYYCIAVGQVNYRAQYPQLSRQCFGQVSSYCKSTSFFLCEYTRHQGDIWQ